MGDLSWIPRKLRKASSSVYYLLIFYSNAPRRLLKPQESSPFILAFENISLSLIVMPWLTSSKQVV